MIALLHAYSRRNQGDGLLVDLSIARLRAAGIRSEEIIVVAVDGQSFTGSCSVVQLPQADGGMVNRSFSIAAWMAYQAGARNRRSPWRPIDEIADAARLIVGVGGGYLRSTGTRAAMATAAYHLPQLLVAARSECDTVYLPQSIGPLRGVRGIAIRNLLSQIGLVYVRDDQSKTELEGIQARRIPDLAVLQLADGLPKIKPVSGRHVVVVARDLTKPDDYVGRIRRLLELMPDAALAVQSAGRGNDDLAFYRRLGQRPTFSSVGEAMESLDGGVVVSVRLHGSLMALLGGWPTVHLAYERKGWGAMADLGLKDYVHPARLFDPSVVAAQVAELQVDPSEYWAHIYGRQEYLSTASDSLTMQISERLGP